MIRNHWYAIARSGDVGLKPYPLQRFGARLVLWRDEKGALHCFEDVCPHRRTRLSLGRVVGNELQCGYHGFRYASDGRCTLMPASGIGARVPARVCAKTYRVVEERGLVHLWWGDGDAVRPSRPWFDDFDDTGLPYAESFVEMPISFCRMMEAGLDFSHFVFVHPSYFTAPSRLTLAKDWQSKVQGERIDFGGRFCADPAESDSKDSVSVEASVLFPSMVSLPLPLDPSGPRCVTWQSPITDGSTWYLVRTYFRPGRWVWLKQALYRWVVYPIVWKKWVYLQDQRMLRNQSPTDNGFDDILPCSSDVGIVQFLKMYEAALHRTQKPSPPLHPPHVPRETAVPVGIMS